MSGREKQREAGRRHYQKNKEKVKAKILAYKRKKRQEWWEYKKSLSCARCGASHPAIIDFHHIDKNDKTRLHVNVLVKAGKFGAAFKEIEKCLILCANCHRIHHYEEMINA